MISHTVKFIQGQWGKVMLYSLTVAILYMGYGCTAYKQVSMPKDDFMANEQIQASLPSYTFYVHDGADTYLMSDVQVVEGKDISGTLSATTYTEQSKDWKRQERKEWWKMHKYDIHLYTNANMTASASLNNTPSLVGSRVQLSNDMIQEIRVMAIDKKAGATEAVVAVVVVVGLIVIVWLLIMNVNNNNTGGGSDSGSGSDSDGGGSSD
jgi:hypothetical protein